MSLFTFQGPGKNTIAIAHNEEKNHASDSWNHRENISRAQIRDSRTCRVFGTLAECLGSKGWWVRGWLQCGSPAPPIPFVSPQADDHQEFEESHGHAIVGLWHVIYTATGTTSGPLPVPVIPPGPPSSFQFVETLKTWHADGTEFENALLPPTGGNFGYGIWKDLGDGHVKLHHIGLMFAPDGSISNIFTVDETDAVASSDKTYKGNFTMKLWPPFFDQVGVGTAVQVIKGTTAATRITVD
jgi:hypothetical protein